MALAIASGCAKAPPAVPVSPPPNPVQQLRSDLEALIDRPGHLRGVWGVDVRSLSRDERLFERNANTLLVPASAMKLVSVAVAAETVGWDYAFETRMLATGPVVDGALKGDLVLVGTGDPSVLGRGSSDSFAPWIEAIRSRGITRIEGRVIGDDDAAEEPKPGFAWSWEDLGYTYGALPGALNASENALTVTVTPALLEGLPPIVEMRSEARDLPVQNLARTNPAGTGTNLWPELRPGEPTLTINGTIAVGEKPAVLGVSVGNPTAWFASSVRNRLLDAGIDVAGKAVDVDDLPVKPDWRGATTLFTYRSPRLADIAKPLLKDSVNLYAEGVLWLATGAGGMRTTDAALDAARERLQQWGIPKDGIQIVDGSGLSRRDVVSPATLIAVLQRFYDDRGTSPFMQALAIAGRDGTLASRMTGTPAEGNVIGKSGSMSNIRTLAGYVRTADGEALAFAVMANNFEGPASDVTATIDRLASRLASFSRTPR